MRLLPSFLLSVFTCGLIYLDNPEPTRDFFQRSSESFQRRLMEKKVSISGLRGLTARDLAPQLPMDRSVFWWLFNGEAVSQTLLKNPLVKSAELKSCSTFALSQWGCFNVAISERTPTYTAQIDNQVWVLGEDGGFLFSVPREKFETVRLDQLIRDHYGPQMGTISSLTQISVKGDSPEIIQARISYTRRAIELIQEVSGLKAEIARCTSQGEVRMRFATYPFEVIFDYAENEPEKLRQEARRLKRLVAEFGDHRLQTIELIDLAYNKLAVVRFQPTPVATRAGRAGKTSSR